jgi:hypothetical protein
MSAPSDERARSPRALPIGKAARILAGYWLFDAVLALFVAMPARAVVDRAYGGHPEGDGALFHAGSLELTELVYRFDPTTSALPSVLLATLLCAAIVGHLPLGVALGSILGKRDVFLRSVAVFPKMVGVYVASGLLKTAVAFGGGALAYFVASGLVDAHGEVSAGTWAIVSATPFLLLYVFLAVIQDYLYVGVVRHDSFRDALMDLRASTRKRRLASLLHYSARNVASLFVLAVGAAIAGALGGHGGFALFVLFAAHQIVQLARIFLRVSWLSYVANGP